MDYIPRLSENAKHLKLEAVNTESPGESFFANSSLFGIPSGETVIILRREIPKGLNLINHAYNAWL